MTTIGLPTGDGYGAIADYIDLRTAVVEEVGDKAFIDRFPRMVRQAESMFSREIRHHKMIEEAPIVISGGVYVLPSNVAQLIGVFDSLGCELQGRTAVRSPAPMYDVYTVEGGTLKGPDGSYTLKYYAKVPTITGGATGTNWLLQDYPELYLWGVTSQVLKSLRRVDEVVAVETLFREELRRVQSDDAAMRYARATVVPQGVNP